MADRPHNADQAMEDSTPFDLNEAIRRWRQGLASSPAFRAENLDELETHLRDSTLALQSGGLTTTEAFLIASRRLGDRAGLEGEFGKTNVRELWLDRSLWMVLGLLLFSFIQRLSFEPEAVMLNLALSCGLSAHWAGASFVFGRWMVPLAGTAAVVWLCTRHGQRLARLAHWCLRRWWLTGLVLLLLLYDVRIFANQLRDFLLSLLGPTAANPPGIQEKATILNAWMRWALTIQQPLWLVLMTVLASYVQRLRCPKSAPAFHLEVAGMPPDQRDLVQRFQAQGLSLDEACLLATRRDDPCLAVEAERPNTHRVMAERALWMVAGVVGNLFVFRFLLEPCWLLARLNARLANQVPVYGHVLGGLCLLLETGVAVLFLAAFWRFVTRSPAATDWIASLCRERPARVALGLILISLGFDRAFVLLGSFLQSRGIPAMGTIVSKWLGWSFVALEIAIPVALLLWLARSRLKLRRA